MFKIGESMVGEMTKLISNWEIGKVKSIRRLRKGVCNINWIIKTNNGNYILRKINSSKELREIDFELKYIDYLRRSKFHYDMPLLIKTKEGKDFIKIKKNYFWLYKYIEGKNLKRFDRLELKQIAKMMSEYRSLIEKSHLNNKNKIASFPNKEVIEEMDLFIKGIHKNKISKKEKVFLKESAKLIPIFNSLDGKEYNKLKKYHIHRDINPENTIWKNGKLKGLVDFENVSGIKEGFIKEISGMLQYSCRDKNSKFKTDLKLARFFINEYKKYRLLSQREIKLIPDMIISGAIEDFVYSYWMLVHDKKRARLYRLNLYSKVAQWHYQNKNKIIKQII